MKVATLDLTPELFVELCKASKEHNRWPRRFVVKKNPLPDDAKVVEVRLREPFLPHTLRLVISSESFAEVPEGATPPELPMIWYETVFSLPDGRDAEHDDMELNDNSWLNRLRRGEQ